MVTYDWACCISSFISHSVKKLNHILKESNKLNVRTGIHVIISFYNISKTLMLMSKMVVLLKLLKKVVSMVLLLYLPLWRVDAIIWNGYGI